MWFCTIPSNGHTSLSTDLVCSIDARGLAHETDGQLYAN